MLLNSISQSMVHLKRQLTFATHCYTCNNEFYVRHCILSVFIFIVRSEFLNTDMLKIEAKLRYEEQGVENFENC